MRSQLLSIASVLLLSGVAHAERPTVVDTTRASEVTLAYHFARGDSQTHVYSATFDAEELEGASRQQYDIQLEMPISYEVQSVDDAGIALVATSIQPPTIAATLDGEPQDTDALIQSFRSARLTTSIANDGTVVDKSGNFAGTENPEDAYAIGFVSDNLAEHWVQFPQEPVSIGDSWLQVVPMDMHDAENNLSATVSIRYTLTGFAQSPVGEVAVIDAVYTTAVDGQMVNPYGRSVRVVGRGRGEGYILFDHARGRLYESGLHDGTVLTATENNGQRTTTAFTQDVNVRAQVVAAGPAR